MTKELDRQNIQGLIYSGYPKLSCASYHLLRVTDRVAARGWLADLVEEITMATGSRKPSRNLAFTHAGIEALGLPDDALATFSDAFQDGMASERRARILGDRNQSDPKGWRWGGPNTQAVHVLLMLFDDDPDALKEEVRRQRGVLDQKSGLVEVLTLEAGRQPDSKEHFGFADGIAQPLVEGIDDQKSKTRMAGPEQQLGTIKAGEFVLGYTNEHGQLSDVPTVASEHDPGGRLPDVQPEQARGLSTSQLGRRDLGLNGSYLVVRQIQQDVAAFWKLLGDAAIGPDGQGNPDRRTYLAAKLVGRWPSGAPLVKHPDEDPHGGVPQATGYNAFTYAADDLDGVRCPIGSHIRRSNPRDSLVAEGTGPEKALQSANRHRLLRRGRAYGDRPADPLVEDGRERGLHFVCLNADIERQFEFVQQTWVNNPVFGGLAGEVDPLIGDQTKVADGGLDSGVMTLQGEPVRTRIQGLHRFTTVIGGAYFFLPGKQALQFLARLGG